MKFVHYSNLKPGAKRALRKAESAGYYTGKKYMAGCYAGKRYITERDNRGRAIEWVLVVGW